MSDQPSTDDHGPRGSTLLIIVGMVALAAAGALYVNESTGEQSGLGFDEPNWAPVLLLLGAGAYLLLLGVILYVGRREE